MGIIFIIAGVIVKGGLFPFHFWFPRVMGRSSWFNCFILRTWQKFGLFYVISGVGLGGMLLEVFIIRATFTRVVGAIGGIGQVYFRVILAYSSLVHSG